MRRSVAVAGLWSCLCLFAAFATSAGTTPKAAAVAAFEGDALQVTFAQPMQTWQGTREAAVRLEPRVPTVCHWQSDDTLYCGFGDADLAAATRYRIDVPAGLKTQTGTTLTAQTLQADTARPELVASVENWSDARPRIVLRSTAPITAAAASAVLRATLAGKPVAPSLQALPAHGDWDRNRRFALDLPPSSTREAAFVLSIVPGLKSTAGPLTGTQRKRLLEVALDEPFRLRGGACAGPREPVLGAVKQDRLTLDCMPGETIRLFFSRAVSKQTLQTWTASWPGQAKFVGTGTEHLYYRYNQAARSQRAPAQWIDLRIDAARTETVLPLPPELRSQGGQPLASAAMVRIGTIDYRPTLRAGHQRNLLRGDTALPTLAESIQAPPASVQVEGIGAAVRRDTLTTPSRADNQPLPIVSETTARTLAEGGWVSWSFPSSNPKTQPRIALQFAAPDFDLFAIAGRREVLAWANAWHGAPIAGAEVELLWQQHAQAQPETIAHGTTAVDGTALIALPDKFVLPEQRNAGQYPMWLLRAASGRSANAQRAVLPLSAMETYGQKLGAAAKQQLWGVADRPLYRAGETVRYRLWLRDSTGGRLLRPQATTPRELRFARQYRSPVKRWTSAIGADGSISGELVLPIHLPDDTYCISQDKDYASDGVCFYVGTFRTQDLWAEAKVEDRVLRDGDRLHYDIQAGYYSGGAAAGVPFTSVSAYVQPFPLQEAYPQYRDFEFVDDDAHGMLALEGTSELTATADGEGRASGELVVAFAQDDDEGPPAFGRIQLVAEAKPSDRESTVSTPVHARYARYRHYVGLRMQPAWLDERTPVELQAVVIDADGREQPATDIEIEVEFRPGFSDDAPGRIVHRCRLKTGQRSGCDFPREKSGRYRLIARSGEAAPAQIERFVWVRGDDGSERDAKSGLDVVGHAPIAGQPLRVALKQNSERGEVLFAFVAGDRVLQRRAMPFASPTQTFALDTQPDWPAKVKLMAYVRTTPKEADEGGPWRRAAVVASLETPVEWAPDDAKPAATVLSFDAASAKPGDTVRIVLRNRGDVVRSAVLAVMDDAMLALAQEQWQAFDPLGDQWLGGLGGGGYLPTVGFSDWNDSPWRRWLSGSAVSAERAPRPECDAVNDAAAAAACAADAAQAAADAAAAAAGDIVDHDAVQVVADGAFNPIDVASVESTDVLSAEQIRRLPMQRDAAAVALLAPGTLAYAPQPAPAPPEPPSVVTEARAVSLDSVQVVGAAAIGPVGTLGANRKREDFELQREERRSALALAQVRTRFADTALWMPDLRLAPGESRTIELKLPDNLTRWRAVAWSSDADDGFEKAEATLAVGLPVEARLQAPVRIFPGDRSRVAANVRQAGIAPVQANAGLRVEGGEQGDAALDHEQTLPLAARGQASFGAEIAPQRVGALTATAYAETPNGRDAVAATIEVASPTIDARIVQVGWLGADRLSLDLPGLPAGASDARFKLSLVRGDTGVVQRWTDDLRDYPHRCWEQILSRAVAAALALERGDKTWPDASAAVQEAVDNAGVFQDEDGGFRYFVQSETSDEEFFEDDQQAQVALTAYSVRALRLLRELGHPVDRDIEPGAQDFLDGQLAAGKGEQPKDAQIDGSAYALAAGKASIPQLDALWLAWNRLTLGARVAATEAFVRNGHTAAPQAVARLLGEAQVRGQARVLHVGRSSTRWMSSSLREQCALIGLLRQYPQLAGADTLRALQAGLFDLYAGGVGPTDTQAGAICLMALRNADAGKREPLSLSAQIGERSTHLSLPAGQDRVDWDIALPAQKTLNLAAQAGETPTAFIAQLQYREDARRADAEAVGFGLRRRHEVLRGGRWQPVADTRIREGDWLRVTLTVDAGAPRYFVAVTDSVPGGLRPTDLSLKGVAGPVLERLSDRGSWAFSTRKLDPKNPRFYAEYLPAGRHEIHYFVRAGNAGDYLAAPALAELMYGEASRARTAATRLRIAATPAPER